MLNRFDLYCRLEKFKTQENIHLQSLTASLQRMADLDKILGAPSGAGAQKPHKSRMVRHYTMGHCTNIKTSKYEGFQNALS